MKYFSNQITKISSFTANAAGSLILGLLFTLPSAKASQPCPAPKESEPVIYNSDFEWGMSLEKMEKKFQEMYLSPKRLFQRAYYDEKSKKYVFEKEVNGKKQKIPMDSAFIKSITKHVEVALKRKYADFIFFPDMGHSHFYVLPEKWKKIENLDHNSIHKIYEILISDPDLKILYHTAEQLKNKEEKDGVKTLIPDEKLLWRYFTRNIVGDNFASDNLEIHFAWDNHNYNTLHEYEGYKVFSAGFNISANQNGCFPYTHDGRTYYFDLSLEDLPSDPNGGGSDY